MNGRKKNSGLRGARRAGYSILAVALTTGLGISSTAAGATTTLTHYGSSQIRNTAVLDAAECPGTPGSSYDAVTDPYSMFNQRRDIGASTFYAHKIFGQNRTTGNPIDIAVIDTGVARGNAQHPFKGFDSGNLVDGPDLSFDSQAHRTDLQEQPDSPDGEYDPLPDYLHNDGFGHGTHISSIIAGRDDANPNEVGNHMPFSWADPTSFTGVAPGARVVNMKVADSQGAVDNTQIIAAIDWAVQHRNDASLGLHIKVINLSYGVNSDDKSDENPVSFAIDQAVKAGISVVVSGGNADSERDLDGHLLTPAFDPNVIAVGAYDAVTGQSTSFSMTGKSRQPDILAPGNHVVALHVPGAAQDDEILDACTEARTANPPTDWSSPIFDDAVNNIADRFVRGSGTSQSAAFVSGAVALLLSQNPTLTPMMVRDILIRSAQPIHGLKSSVGAGLLNLTNAFDRKSTASRILKEFGGGFISRSRGVDALPCLSQRSVDANGGTFVHGSWTGGACSTMRNMRGAARRSAMNVDVRGLPFDSEAHAAAELVDARGNYVNGHGPWTPATDGYGAGEAWNGAVWAGASWAADPDTHVKSWTGHRWSSSDWLGHRWDGGDWTGHRWDASAWDGHRWDGHRWSSDALQGHRWSDDSWTGHRWSSHTFADNAWS